MVTITEDYVSFETAKLLKEKGFNGPCRSHYMVDTGLQRWTQNYGWNTSPLIVLCPTQQMVMKWLREVYNWNIFINKSNTIYGYDANIESLVTNHVVEIGCEKTYENACEVAIKYCLENLI